MNKTVGNDALMLSLTRIFNLMMTMVCAMLLSRFRTLEDYGTYSQLMIVTNIAVSLFALGLPSSMNYFLGGADTARERAEFLKTYYTTNTVVGVVCGLFLFAATPVILSYFNNPMLSRFWYVLVLFPWVKLTNNGIDNFFIIYKKTNQLILFRLRYGITTFGIIIIAMLFKWSFYKYMYFFIGTELFFTGFTYYIVWKISGVRLLGFDSGLLKKILSFSIPIGLASVVATFNINLDTLMIGRLLGTEALAIYANAAREMPVTMIASSITAVLMPHLVKLLKKDKNEEAIGLWGQSITLSYIFMCFFSMVLFVFAPQIMSLLYSDKYLGGVNVFRIYSLVLLLRMTYFGMILNAIGKTKLILVSSILSIVINGVLNYILFRFFGFIGPALATVISISIVNFTQLFISSKLLKIPFEKIFPWLLLLKITSVNIILALIVYSLSNLLQRVISLSPFAIAILLGVIWTMIYLFIMKRKIQLSWKFLNS